MMDDAAKFNGSKCSDMVGAKKAPVIAVDLDGTLMCGDSMLEALSWMWAHKAWRMLWLLLTETFMSRAQFKWKLYSEVKFFSMKWNEPLIDWLRQRKAAGQKIVLATAAPQFRAEEIAQVMGGLFDEVIGSTQSENRRAKNKAKVLERRFGIRGFDYVGNSQADLPVWKAAKVAYNVNPSKRLRLAAAGAGVELILVAENPQSAVMEGWDDCLRTWKWLRWALLLIIIGVVSCGGLH